MENLLHILIVEDDADARESLVHLLSLDHHHVEAVGTARAALDNPDLADKDVIVLDRQLPDGLAEELLPRLRELAPHSELIVIAGDADLEGTIRALREGAADYILKPINPDALRASLVRIAERRRIECELQKERRFAENILQTAEAIILVLDLDGRILRFNPYLTQLTGYTLEEVRHQNWFEKFVAGRDVTRVRGVFGRTVEELNTRGVVNSIRTKAGRLRSVRWSNTTLKDEHGQPVAILSVGLDVTHVIQAQDQLLQSERLAAIGQTMAGLAHESRNSLQRIQAALEVLELQFEDEPEILRDLATIDKASRDLRNLLEEVRGYAAPIHLERRATFLPAIWQRAWVDLEHARDKRQAVLIEQLPESPLRCRVDERRLEQVFRNLFENALDACQDPVTITIRGTRAKDGVLLTLQDDGPGLPRQHCDKVFDAFFTTKPTGTGLGLAIAKRIIEAHKGVIELAQHDGTGTEFEIFLPAE